MQWHRFPREDHFDGGPSYEHWPGMTFLLKRHTRLARKCRIVRCAQLPTVVSPTVGACQCVGPCCEYFRPPLRRQSVRCRPRGRTEPPSRPISFHRSPSLLLKRNRPSGRRGQSHRKIAGQGRRPQPDRNSRPQAAQGPRWTHLPTELLQCSLLPPAPCALPASR